MKVLVEDNGKVNVFGGFDFEFFLLRVVGVDRDGLEVI